MRREGSVDRVVIITSTSTRRITSWKSRGKHTAKHLESSGKRTEMFHRNPGCMAAIQPNHTPPFDNICSAVIVRWMRGQIITTVSCCIVYCSYTPTHAGPCAVSGLQRIDAPCGLRGCKNRPAPFPGRMSYKSTKPGLVCLSYLSMLYYCIVVY